jgi:hypothetical protein
MAIKPRMLSKQRLLLSLFNPRWQTFGTDNFMRPENSLCKTIKSIANIHRRFPLWVINFNVV